MERALLLVDSRRRGAVFSDQRHFLLNSIAICGRQPKSNKQQPQNFGWRFHFGEGIITITQFPGFARRAVHHFDPSKGSYFAVQEDWRKKIRWGARPER